jgi:hypothetical protein
MHTANSERAAKLVLERWREQLTTSFVPRRSRTIGACAALEEVLLLAESWVRSGGQTRPAVDPSEGGHGVLMLPDVAEEAAVVLREDPILRRRYPRRKEVLDDIVTKLRAKENVAQSLVEQLRAILVAIRNSYISDAFEEMSLVLTNEPKRHQELISLVDGIVGELRAKGWSDESLDEALTATHASQPESMCAAVAVLRRIVGAGPSEYECYVSLTLPSRRPQFPKDDPSFELVEHLPDVQRTGRPQKEGPYARVRVSAYDPASAASIAHRRVLSTLGALTVFLAASRIEVSSEVVGVRMADGNIRSYEVQERLLEEKRSLQTDGVTRILASSWRASSTPAADPLHDAIRLRHRALLAADAESRLLLLWSGLERITSGARGYDAALSAAKELISHAVALGKLRRDLSDLVACITHEVSSDEERRKALLNLVGGYRTADSSSIGADRLRVLEYLLAEEKKLRELLGIFYEQAPLLVHRCHSLWQDFGEGNSDKRGEAIFTYFERSRTRIAWQVGRIYRARNRIAHVGSGPDRLRDLVWHAHFYLTQLLALCVHYGERSPKRAQEILTHRAGQYRAFVRLVRAGDPSCLTAAALMRPVSVVGGEGE